MASTSVSYSGGVPFSLAQRSFSADAFPVRPQYSGLSRVKVVRIQHLAQDSRSHMW